MAQLHDIAILGATPAGLAAACALGRKHKVAVMVCPPQDVECPLTDWTPGSLLGMAGMPRSLVSQSQAESFKVVRYYNASLTDEAENRSRSVTGHFVNVASLVRALRAAASKSGTVFRSTTTAPTVRLEEDAVELRGTTSIRAKLLIVASGRPSDALGDLGLPVHSLPSPPLTVAGLDVPLGRKADGDGASGALHVVETTERSEMGLYFVHGGTLHLRLISTSHAAGNRASELSALLADLQAAERLPKSLPLGKAKGAVWHPPAAMALDMETHVAKRCLIAGSAGGFADPITGQTLYPSIRSSVLAADVAAKALAGDDPQNDLAPFKSLWRNELADYLRPPSTSLQMLLPLMFVNRQIVQRFTAALVEGESI